MSFCVGAGLLLTGCGRSNEARPEPGATPVATRPSILLVTLDTTRADVVGPDARGVETPAFNALVARGRWFRQAYATAPETLPAHASILTGLYPAGHGVHENARTLSSHPTIAERLKQAGYGTSADVSSFVLARRFGLARASTVRRCTGAGRGRAKCDGDDGSRGCVVAADVCAAGFTWVHYFDPHAPYTPPEPFRTRYASSPYHGEVAAMDEQLGRLVQAFERSTPAPHAIIVVADHGEGLGDHGEALHGNLVYQSTMHVPLVVVGPGFDRGISDAPASTRRIFHTLLDWAGAGSQQSLRRDAADVVLGEAMKPFLEYGWQPQIMAVEGRRKAIFAGRTELYDVIADPREADDLAKTSDIPGSLRKALETIPCRRRKTLRRHRNSAKRRGRTSRVSAT